MKFSKFLMPVLLIAGLFACSTVPSFKRAENPQALSQSEAAERAMLLSNIHYKMEISLGGELPSYYGKQTISFNLKEKAPLRLDFIDGEVESLAVNGKEIAKVEYNKSWITIPEDSLKEGSNQVVVNFKHPYSKRGAGLHRFEDPADGRVYTYSDFEPFDANKFAPFFDQPDLKATYELMVRAPETWKVITSVYPDSTLMKSDYKVWYFPKSEKFSTYIFSLHAGPYKVWRDKYVAKDGQVIPLDIFARQSMAKYLAREVRDWFKVTKQGFEFYQSFFDTKYPYQKYAQLLVPEFNSGAMENVAAVTFNEHAIHRTKASYAERRGRSNTILHEMAHMWFGDLVTMKWWNNLWLNESFATFMAFLALEKNTEFKDSFEYFYSRTKQWAYWNDDLVITHPILGEVKDTDQAMLSFDGITYGKGASVLKQLYYYLGEENFKKGLKLYFTRHAGGNTVLKDFFAAFEEVSGIKFDPWVNEWLKTAGTNTAKADYSCKAGKVDSFAIVQSYKEGYPTLRTHKTQVALLNKKKGKLAVGKTFKVEYKGARTELPELKGADCPEVAFINYKDFDFAHVEFGENDLAAIKKNLSRIDDDMVRLMAYNSLFDMVKHGKLSLRKYTRIVMPHLKKERNYNVVVNGLDGLRTVVGYLFAKEIEDEALIRKVEKFFWRQMKRVKNPELKREYFNSFRSVAHTPNALKALEKIYLGKVKLKRIPIGLDQKWWMVKHLASYSWPKVEKYMKQLEKRDHSDRAKRSILAIESSKSDLATKKKWYKLSMEKDTPYSLKEMGSALTSLFPRTQRDLKKKVTASFYTDLKGHMLDRQIRMQRMFIGSFVPAFCDKSSSDELDGFIKANQKLPVAVMKTLKIALQENNRCIHVKY